MTKSDTLLGAYQLAGGLISATSLLTPMAQRHWSAVGFLIVFSSVSVFAGILHLLGDPRRHSLSIANQLTQVLGFYTPLVSIAVVHGAAARLSFLFDWKGVFAQSIFNVSAAFAIPESTCDVNLFGSLPGLHTLGLTINFLALGVLLHCLRQKRKLDRANEEEAAREDAAVSGGSSSP